MSTHTPPPPLSFLLIDDDVNFCQLMASYASELNLKIDTFTSLYDVGSMAAINKYDAIILDFYVGRETASQITEYLESFCIAPVIVISAVPIDPHIRKKFPHVVKDFSVKAIGPSEILRRCQALTMAKGRYIWRDLVTPNEWVDTSTD